MSGADQSVMEDTELVEMLIGEPELLAIAEALVVTGSMPERHLAPAPSSLSSRRSWRLAPIAATVAAVAVALALLLVSPWGGSPTLAESALAAVGSGPVLHVVVSQPASAAEVFVELASGQTTRPTLRTEIWFDRAHDLKKTVFKMNGRVLDEQLETKAGGWTRTGPIYTCAWIAAHPLEATKAGVNCNAGPSRSGSPVVPELDPALSGFVDRYQLALASGQATELGRGTIAARDVIWLQFEVNGMLERVAIDADTRKPVLLKGASDDFSLDVIAADTMSYNPSLFAKPKPVKTQGGGSVDAQEAVTVEQAAAILGRQGLWLGKTWNDLRLVSTTHENRTIGYGPEEEPGHADVIKFTYSRVDADGRTEPHSRVDIYEATTCLVSVGWTCTARDPSAPDVFVSRGPISLLQTQGLYVSIWTLPNDQQSPSLEIARALTPAAATQ